LCRALNMKNHDHCFTGLEFVSALCGALIGLQLVP
jgi:hypothetical protein